MDTEGRRSIRLPGYDYSQPGYYFVTICSFKKANLFGAIIEGEIELSRLGFLVQSRWMNIPQHFVHISIDTFVVMPNHFHGILVIQDDGRGTIYRAPTEGFGKPTRGSIPTMMRVFKAAVTREWRMVCRDPTFMVWQRNYFERIIRDNDELNLIRSYIAHNPLRWSQDCYYHP